MGICSLTLEARIVLMQLFDAINQLTHDEYTQKNELLSNSSIGEHTRHIIEFFQQLLAGYETGHIDYDERRRNIEIEKNIDYAVEAIANIIGILEKNNKQLELKTVYNNHETNIESNYYRELLFNIEHCIHHQASIKIAFLLLGKSKTDDEFGVAKSTLMNRQCVL